MSKTKKYSQIFIILFVGILSITIAILPFFGRSRSVSADNSYPGLDTDFASAGIPVGLYYPRDDVPVGVTVTFSNPLSYYTSSSSVGFITIPLFYASGSIDLAGPSVPRATSTLGSSASSTFGAAFTAIQLYTNDTVPSSSYSMTVSRVTLVDRISLSPSPSDPPITPPSFDSGYLGVQMPGTTRTVAWVCIPFSANFDLYNYDGAMVWNTFFVNAYQRYIDGSSSEELQAKYDEGYSNGFNKAQTSQLANPLNAVLQPVSAFLDTPFFGTFTIGNFLTIVIFVLLAMVFLKMFAGG